MKKGKSAKWSRSLTLLFICFVIVLGGCSSSSGSPEAKEPAKGQDAPADKGKEPADVAANTDKPEKSVPSKDSFKGTVKVLREWGDQYTDRFDEITAAFQKDYPNIKLEFINTGAANLAALVAANDGPDLVQTYGPIPAFIDDGLLEDLEPFMALDREVTPDTFYEPAFVKYKVDGKLYGLPWFVDPNFSMAYNKKLFEKYGATEIPPLNTLDDVKNFLKRFWIVNNGEQEMTTFNPTSLWGTWNAFLTWSFMNGATSKQFYDPDTKKTSLNEPQFVQALEWMVQFKREYIDDARMQKLTDTLPANTDLFGGGKMAVQFLVAESARNLRVNNPDKEIAFGQFPEKSFWLGGFGFSMVSSSKNKEAAWEVLKWLTTSDTIVNMTWGTFGSVPAKKEAPALAEKAKTDEILGLYMDILRKTKNYPAMFPVEFMPEWDARMAQVMAGEMEPKAMLDHMQKYIQQLIDEKYK